ncbi:MAG: hypothetical protein ACK54L_18945 [Betaproteobacteria bacterium]
MYREGLTVAEAAEVLERQAAAEPEHADHVLRLRQFVVGSQRGIIR